MLIFSNRGDDSYYSKAGLTLDECHKIIDDSDLSFFDVVHICEDNGVIVERVIENGVRL